ncbi:cupin domain-containing protein [Thioclava sp. 'Guangxiensis']|uniref:cupin domain-containing protein n=1 Tax=Thioclava sp. 'Guangxiensis' TaxID=3149044 RepID=UPI003877D8FE
MEFDVGARLKAVRKARKMSQREMAAKSGITNGMISLIEGNKTSPSISSLKKILEALDLTLSEFFESDAAVVDKFVFRHDELERITPEQVDGSGINPLSPAAKLQRLGYSQGSSLLMLYETYEPGADTGEPYTHEGEEAGFVIEGELLLEVDGEVEVLQVGDGYKFASTKPHRFRNIGSVRCVVISACTPPTF